MKNLIVGSWVGFLGLMMLSACDGSGGTCGNTAACGGDIVGTWNVTSSCVSASPSMMGSASCTGAKTTSSTLAVTGTIAYRANMTYTSNLTLSGSVTVFTPTSCLTSGGFTLTCEYLNQLIMSDAPGSRCVSSSGGCSCTIVSMNQPTTATGTFTTTAAGLLTQTPAGDTPDQSDYCVKDTVLTVSPHAGSTMMGADVSGTITLSKQ